MAEWGRFNIVIRKCKAPHRGFSAINIIAALLLAASGSAAQTPPPTPPPTPPETQAPAQLPDSPGAGMQPKVAIVPTGPTAVFDTTVGRLTCKLFDKQSPLAAANFIGLAEGTKDWTDPTTGQIVHGKRFYDGTTFHRVIPGFMIQGGDRRGDGTGDAGFYFDNENTPGLTFDVAGRLAMANAGPNTNGTQFFITETAVPDLDGKYSIFGQCDAHSVLMVATIARMDRNSQDKPLTAITVNKVTIVREGQAMPPDPMPPAPSAPAAAVPAIPAMPPPK
jgi:peptidyl-prolyl cis-trans isomerase A (cyclophilin A)